MDQGLLLWAAMAALTALVLGLLLRPLLRGAAAAAPPPAPDLAVYRDQLTEIERAAGRLPEGEAALARREVERRLLRAGAAVAAPGGSRPPARGLALALLLLVPLLGLGLYLAVGAPELPARPLAGREAELADYRRLTAEVAELRAQVQQRPDDALAWRRLGLALIALGEVEAAVAAIQTALEQGAPPSETFALVAEAIIRKNGGAVPPMARQMLAQAIELDPENWLALFLTGFALEQDGQPAAALELWRMIAAETAGSLPWQATLEAQIRRLEAPAPTP